MIDKRILFLAKISLFIFFLVFTEGFLLKGQPSILSPAANAIDIPTIFTAEADFSPENNLVQKSYWEIYSDAALTNRVWSATKDTSPYNKIRVDSVNGVFEDGLIGVNRLRSYTSYWIRVRYVNTSNGISQWSTLVQFTTENHLPSQPQFITPAFSGETGFSLNPHLEVTPFSDIDTSDGDYHLKTKWIIYTAEPYDAHLVWSSETSVYLTSIDVNTTTGHFYYPLGGVSLEYRGYYNLKVIFYDSRGGTSEANTAFWVKGQNPNKPTILSVEKGILRAIFTPEIEASAFSDPDGDNMISAIWEVYSDAALTNRVWSATDNNPDSLLPKTKVDKDHGIFEDGLIGLNQLKNYTNYWVRVKYKDDFGGESDWSDPYPFTTEAFPPDKPVFITPLSGETNLGLNLTLEVGPFSDPELGEGDYHYATDWAITKESNGRLVWFTTETQLKKLSIEVTVENGTFTVDNLNGVSLEYFTWYLAGARFHDSRGMTSEWSIVRFRTKGRDPLTPEIVWPLKDTDPGYDPNYHHSVNLTLEATDFQDPDITADPNTTDYCAKSEWEVWLSWEAGAAAIPPPMLAKHWTGTVTVDAPPPVHDDYKRITVEVTADSSFQPLPQAVAPTNPPPYYNSYLASQTHLFGNARYAVKVKYYDSTGLSTEWSEWRLFTTEILPPLTPEIQVPANNATDVFVKPFMKTYDFVDGDYYDTQLKSDWEIYSDSSLAPDKLVWYTHESTTQLTTIEVNATYGIFTNELSSRTQLGFRHDYWIRVRFYDSHNLVSVWSPVIKITTQNGNNPPQKPVIIYPDSKYLGYNRNLTMEASAFVDIDGDSHAKTDWYIYDSSDMTSPHLVWSSIGDTINLTKIKVDSNNGAFSNALAGKSSLEVGQTYWVTLKYYDSYGGSSVLADPVSFEVGAIEIIYHTDEANPPYDNDTHLLFTWETSEVITNFSHYNIYFSIDGGPYYFSTTTTSDHFTLEVGPASEGHEYNLRLQYVTKDGKESISFEATAILGQPGIYTRVDLHKPDTPEVHHINEPLVNYDDDGQIEFGWTDVSGGEPHPSWFSHYDIYYRENNGPIQFIKSTTDLSYTLEGNVGMTYELLVVAVDGAGHRSDTGESEQVLVTLPPVSPSTPHHDNNDDNFYIPPQYDNDAGLHFSWSEPIPSDVYQVNVYVGLDLPAGADITDDYNYFYTLPVSAIDSSATKPNFTVDVSVPPINLANPHFHKVGIKLSYTNQYGLTSELTATSEPYPVLIITSPPDTPNTPVLSTELNYPYTNRNVKFVWQRRNDYLKLYYIHLQRMRNGVLSDELIYKKDLTEPLSNYYFVQTDEVSDMAGDKLQDDDRVRCRIEAVYVTGQKSLVSSWSEWGVVDTIPPTKPKWQTFETSQTIAKEVNLNLYHFSKDSHLPITYYFKSTKNPNWVIKSSFPFTEELVENQRNYFYIKAVDAAGLTSEVDVISIVQNGLPVNAPGKPIHNDSDAPVPWDNDFELNFSWSPPTQGIVSYYEVFVSRNANSFIWDGVSPTNSYVYRVRYPYSPETDSYRVKVVVHGVDGSMMTSPASDFVKLDVLAPRPDPKIDRTKFKIDLTTGEYYTYSRYLTIELTVLILTDENGFIYQMRGGPYQNWQQVAFKGGYQIIELPYGQRTKIEVRGKDPANNYTKTDYIWITSKKANLPQPPIPHHFDADANTNFDNDKYLEFRWEPMDYPNFKSYLVYLDKDDLGFSYWGEIYTNEVVINVKEEGTYKIKLKLKDQEGNTSIFSAASPPVIVDFTPARLQKSSIQDGEQFVATTTSIDLWFDEPLSPTTVNTKTVLLYDEDNMPVLGKVQISNNYKQITFIPENELKHGHTYKFMVLKKVTDLAGNPLSDDIIISFYTKSAGGLKVSHLLSYPSPIRYSGTTFSYYLNQDADEVRVEIYAMDGSKIITIRDCPAWEGYNQIFWDGFDRKGNSLPNGVYFVKVVVKKGDAEDFVRGKIMVLK